MQQLDTDLWIADAPLRFLGLEVGTRMTVVRLLGSELLLHSPIATTPELVREVESLGRVAHLVAPNRLHHLYVGEWKEACPEAAIHAAPGLETKRADLEIATVLGDEPEPAWKGTLDQVYLPGFPFANEVVFFHRPSATLLVTDLAFNFGASAPVMTRLFVRVAGTYDQLAPTLLEKLLIRDRAAFRIALERILEWPFERVVVTHGEVLETGGREALARGYSWLLGEGKE